MQDLHNQGVIKSIPLHETHLHPPVIYEFQFSQHKYLQNFRWRQIRH